MILLELVPSSYDVLVQTAKNAITEYTIDGINVPDILRLPNRSHDAVKPLLQHNIDAVPHIRCIDRPLDETMSHIATLVDAGLKRVLIVSGDKPSDDKQTYDVSPMALISSIKATYPNVLVYGALDPYRQDMTAELAYCQQKLDAGADGVFSQPFFDTELAKAYLEALSHTQLFLGISPVTTEKSKRYWKTVNNVVFSSAFDPTLAYNAALADDLIGLANRYDQHVYLMPITLDPITYLKSVTSLQKTSPEPSSSTTSL